MYMYMYTHIYIYIYILLIDTYLALTWVLKIKAWKLGHS